MADGHTDTSSASNVSDSSSNFHYEGNSFDFEQYLSYNADKKRIPEPATTNGKQWY